LDTQWIKYEPITQVQVAGRQSTVLFMTSLDGLQHIPVEPERSVPYVEWMELHHSKLSTLIKVALPKD
jgi:hypothetical protein